METHHSDVIGCFIWNLHETLQRRTKGQKLRTTETSWRRSTETSLGVSFEAYLRRREDILIGRHHYVPLRRRHDIPRRRREDVPLRRCWVFHLRRTCDVTGMYRETSLRQRHDVLLPGRFFFMRTRLNSFYL